MTFCLFWFYILFPNNLVTKIFLPGKQGIYLQNGIVLHFYFINWANSLCRFLKRSRITSCLFYGYLRLARLGGGGLFSVSFNKEIRRGVCSLIARCISKGFHWPRWVKPLNGEVQECWFCTSYFLLELISRNFRWRNIQCKKSTQQNIKTV